MTDQHVGDGSSWCDYGYHTWQPCPWPSRLECRWCRMVVTDEPPLDVGAAVS